MCYNGKGDPKKIALEDDMVVIQLAKLLEAKHITRAEFAKRTGIRPPTISYLCNNKSSFIKLEQISRICNELLCDIGDLLKLSDK